MDHVEPAGLRLTNVNSKIIVPDVSPHSSSQPKNFSSQSSLQTRVLLSMRTLDLCNTGGRAFENCVEIYRMLKDVVGILKIYGMFRAKHKGTEQDRLRWIKEKEAWENGGRRILREVSSLSLNKRTVEFQQRHFPFLCTETVKKGSSTSFALLGNLGIALVLLILPKPAYEMLDWCYCKRDFQISLSLSRYHSFPEHCWCICWCILRLDSHKGAIGKTHGQAFIM